MFFCRVVTFLSLSLHPDQINHFIRNVFLSFKQSLNDLVDVSDHTDILKKQLRCKLSRSSVGGLGCLMKWQTCNSDLVLYK